MWADTAATAWSGLEQAARDAVTHPNLTPEEAALLVRRHVTVTTAALAHVLELATADGWLVGAHTAFGQPVTKAAAPGGVTVGLDWSTWTPGWSAAADLVDSDAAGITGLQTLLRASGAIIKGITERDLARLGSVLYDGVHAGDSIDTIGRAMRAVVTDPDRARTIANTETNRAMTTSSIDAYRSEGLEEYDWLAEDDACEDCAAMADANPHPLDEDPPPYHPNCRCAVAPVVPDDGDLMAELDDTGDGSDALHPELTVHEDLAAALSPIDATDDESTAGDDLLAELDTTEGTE